MTAQAVADLVGGRLFGHGEVALQRVRSLEGAESDSLAMCTGPRYAAALADTRAGAVLVPEALSEAKGPATRIVVRDPARAMALAANALHPQHSGAVVVDATARIGRGTRLGDEVRIGAYAVIGTDVQIGDRCIIGPHVVLEDGVTLR